MSIKILILQTYQYINANIREVEGKKRQKQKKLVWDSSNLSKKKNSAKVLRSWSLNKSAKKIMR